MDIDVPANSAPDNIEQRSFSEIDRLVDCGDYDGARVAIVRAVESGELSKEAGALQSRRIEVFGDATPTARQQTLASPTTLGPPIGSTVRPLLSAPVRLALLMIGLVFVVRSLWGLSIYWQMAANGGGMDSIVFERHGFLSNAARAPTMTVTVGHLIAMDVVNFGPAACACFVGAVLGGRSRQRRNGML